MKIDPQQTDVMGLIKDIQDGKVRLEFGNKTQIMAIHELEKINAHNAIKKTMKEVECEQCQGAGSIKYYVCPACKYSSKDAARLFSIVGPTVECLKCRAQIFPKK